MIKIILSVNYASYSSRIPPENQIIAREDLRELRDLSCTMQINIKIRHDINENTWILYFIDCTVLSKQVNIEIWFDSGLQIVENVLNASRI